MTALGVLGALLIGVLLGATGGGGSILAVPLFVHVLHIEPKVAVAMSLPVVGMTSLVGAIGHWRSGHVALRPALAIGALAMAGAFAGARLSALFTGRAQLMLLGAIMIVAAVALWRRSNGTAPPAADDALSWRRMALLAAVALGIGVLTGLVGIGGGFLFAPALVLLAGLPMSQAAGTSLVIIALNAAAGFAGYAGRVTLPWTTVAIVVVLASVASLLGVALVRAVPQQTIQRSFAVLLLAIAVTMFYPFR